MFVKVDQQMDEGGIPESLVYLFTISTLIAGSRFTGGQ